MDWWIRFVVCDDLAGEKHWSAETMNSWTCPSKSLEYIKVLEQCRSERISRLGLVQVYDVSCWNPVCLVLSDCWGMSDIFLTMIWFISLGKTTTASRISPAQSAGTPSKSFVPPQSGMSYGSTEGAWMYRGLSSSSFPQPFPSLFLYSSCPLVLFPCLFCMMSGFVMPDSPLSSSLFDSLHFVTMTSILPDFSSFFFTGWGVCEETEPFPWTFLPYYLHKWIPPKSTNSLEDQVQHLLTTIILYASQKIHLNQKKRKPEPEPEQHVLSTWRIILIGQRDQCIISFKDEKTNWWCLRSPLPVCWDSCSCWTFCMFVIAQKVHSPGMGVLSNQGVDRCPFVTS